MSGLCCYLSIIVVPFDGHVKYLFRRIRPFYNFQSKLVRGQPTID
jgi:hypothetical protein